MELTTEVKGLKEALDITKHSVPSRGSALPCLTGVHLSADGDTLVVTATDLDLTIQTSVPATVREAGIALAPHALFAKVLKKSGGNVELTAEGEEFRSVNGFRTTMRALPVDEYPKLPKFDEGGKWYPLDLEAIEDTARAASTEDSRPILTGMFFHDNKVVATDSYRLHVLELPEATQYPEVLIPARALWAAIKIAGRKFDKPASIAFREHEAVIAVGDVRIVSRIIEGQFPNYRQLIPSSFPNFVEVDKDKFRKLVDAVSVMVRDVTTPVRLVFTPTGLTATVISQEIGTSEGDMPATATMEATLAFNPKYLLDVTDVPGATVRIEFTDALKPAAAVGIDGRNNRHVRLLMPVRVP